MIFQSTYCDWTQQEGNLENPWTQYFQPQISAHKWQSCLFVWLFFSPFLCRCQRRQVLALGAVEQWLVMITGAKAAYCKLYSLQPETLFLSSPRINHTTDNGDSQLSPADCNYSELFWHLPWASIFNTLNQTVGCHFWHSGGDRNEGKEI